MSELPFVKVLVSPDESVISEPASQLRRDWSVPLCMTGVGRGGGGGGGGAGGAKTGGLVSVDEAVDEGRKVSDDVDGWLEC